MDPDITSWIIELLLRQRQVPDALINKLLTNPLVPLDNNNLRLKKTLLLRSIDSQISDGSVSESILDDLQIIEQLDRINRTKIFDSMKLAYCAVAAECTVKYMLGNLRYGCRAKYLKAVQRIWRDRIHKLEMVKKSDLVTPELRKWKEDIEGSLHDSNLLSTFKDRNTASNALILTGNYVVEAMAAMGPPFLLLVARFEREAKENEEKEQLLKEAKEATGECGRGVTDHRSKLNIGPQFDASDVSRQEISATRPHENLEKKSLLRNHKHVAAVRRSKGPARITDCNELELEIGSSKDNTLPIPVVKQPQEALKSSFLESQAKVDDSPKVRTNHTILRDNPKKRKMWTLEEEDALRAGVNKFGQGNWKLILNSKRSIFGERTEVNLKDKWRNMTK